MAINKVSTSSKSHGAMRNVIQYVLQDKKVKNGFVEITGPYDADTINWDDVYKAFLHEKRLWNKDSGRMYAHNIISFHKDEKITPEQCLAIGTQFVEHFFSDYQSLIAVHLDKEHLHVHIVSNSVSFVDGKKIHQTKHDLERQKEYTNSLCKSMSLSVAEKGKHFDGSVIEEGNIITWNKDKYHFLTDKTKKSYMVDCAVAVIETVAVSVNRQEFVAKMKERGWNVKWEDTRKHIVFQDSNGNKVRDSNLSKTFSLDISKEALSNEFDRNSTLSKYNAEINSAEISLDITKTVSDHSRISGISGKDYTRTGRFKGTRQTRGYRTDTGSSVRERKIEGRNINAPGNEKSVTGKAAETAGTVTEDNKGKGRGRGR